MVVATRGYIVNEMPLPALWGPDASVGMAERKAPVYLWRQYPSQQSFPRPFLPAPFFDSDSAAPWFGHSHSIVFGTYKHLKISDFLSGCAKLTVKSTGKNFRLGLGGD
jgi:hypothetical protein